MLYFVTKFYRLRQHDLTALVSKPPRVVVLSYVSNRKLSNISLMACEGKKEKFSIRMVSTTIVNNLGRILMTALSFCLLLCNRQKLSIRVLWSPTSDTAALYGKLLGLPKNTAFKNFKTELREVSPTANLMPRADHL